MKQEQGMVMSVADGLAHVKVGRHEDCSGCGACASSRNVFVDAVNRVGAQPGQRVRFAVQEEKVLLAAFMVFVLPLLAAALGAAAGWQAALSYGWEEDYAMGIGALVFFLLSWLLVRCYDRRVSRNQQGKPVIIEILP